LTGAGKVAATRDDIDVANLPTLVKPQDMFDDLVSRFPEIAEFAAEVKRPLRVATMCSGTEAPLLALEMVSQALQTQHDGLSLEVEHIFSCEIEPWKQAYIERNFGPPILFRDIRELGSEEATTAYGARVKVPGEIDILIAGTSCVDNSALNPTKIKRTEFGDEMVARKKAEQLRKMDMQTLSNSKMGESGQTFFGMMSWVQKHKPTVVILENVVNALWELMRQQFILEGYHAEFVRLDTKHYYIPHTRTRTYLFAVLKSDAVHTETAKKWVTKVKEMARPSTDSLEQFLLPADDPRIMKIREDMEADLRMKSRSRVDWEKCAQRHKHERESRLIGSQRPVTNWEEGGTCRIPDFGWQEWAKVFSFSRFLALRKLLF
jgi:site-specific DNA-cytosine methylase